LIFIGGPSGSAAAAGFLATGRCRDGGVCSARVAPSGPGRPARVHQGAVRPPGGSRRVGTSSQAGCRARTTSAARARRARRGLPEGGVGQCLEHVSLGHAPIIGKYSLACPVCLFVVLSDQTTTPSGFVLRARLPRSRPLRAVQTIKRYAVSSGVRLRKVE
jgi:hypothetical protein